jgi:hypothetical protein
MFLFKNKKIISNLLSVFILTIFILPTLVMSQQIQIITCGNSTSTMCGYADFVGTINNIVDWVIASAGVIFTISAIWGGFLYIFSGTNPSYKAKAKSILWSTIIGFIIVLCSWLIVYTLLGFLVDKGTPSGQSIFKFIGN